MAIGGSFGTVGGGVQAINTGAVDSQGRRSGDLGFTRFFGRGPVTIAPIRKPKPQDWWEQNGAQARIGIAGYEPTLDQPKVDLFQQYGGYGGLIGLQKPLGPGTYKLNDILGIPTIPGTPAELQYSKEEATQNLSRQLAGIANSGGTLPPLPQGIGQSPLSPTNLSKSKKGGPVT